MPLDQNPVKDILYRTTARYLTVGPQGIRLARLPSKAVKTRVLAYGPARTLYRGRKPFCRSLDAIRSTDAKTCADCLDLKHCTSQIRIHLLIDDRPYCLLLAYTSAKNFLLYQAQVAQDREDLQNVITQVTVVDRGSWGELRFHRA